MERWSNEESETQCYTVRTEQENMLGYLNYFSRFKPSTLAQTWFTERRSRDPLPKYYSDRGVFQVFRARAGSNIPILQAIASMQSQLSLTTPKGRGLIS
jgi:hypothetical protein